jgi:hypothetical protein
MDNFHQCYLTSFYNVKECRINKFVRPYEIIFGYSFPDEWWVFKDRIETRNDLQQLHSFDDKPAIIFFNIDGNKFREEWYHKGVIHREQKPAVIEYYFEDKIKRLEFRLGNILHRDNKPALILFDNRGKILCEEYYQYDLLHNENGPAVRTFSGDSLMNIRWYISGHLHNTKGPAAINYKNLMGPNFKQEFYLLGKEINENYNKKAFIWNLIQNKLKKFRRQFLFKILINTKLKENGIDVIKLIIEKIIP